MRQKIILILLSIILTIPGYSQKKKENSKIPEPFHINVKAFQKGEPVFKMNTQKQTISMHVPKEKRDTSFSFKWEQNEKITFLKYLVEENRLDEMETHSIPKPKNVKNRDELLFVSIQKGKKNIEFWAAGTSDKKDKPGSFEAMAFLQKLMEHYGYPSFKMGKTGRRQR